MHEANSIPTGTNLDFCWTRQDHRRFRQLGTILGPQTTRPQIFPSKLILSQEGFDRVDWPNFYQVMHTVPRLFQLWACKQIMSIASTNKARSRFTADLSPLCPSCNTEEETCSHILNCSEQGRSQVFDGAVDLLDEWLGFIRSFPRATPHGRYCPRTGTRLSFSWESSGYDRMEKVHGGYDTN